MEGESGLTPETDVYAFAILSTEVFSMGEIPWPMDDDSSVRFLVVCKWLPPPLQQSIEYLQPGISVQGSQETSILRYCITSSTPAGIEIQVVDRLFTRSLRSSNFSGSKLLLPRLPCLILAMKQRDLFRHACPPMHPLG